MLFRVFTRNMSQNLKIKIVNNAEIAEKRLAELRSKLQEYKKIKIEEKIEKLLVENVDLSGKIRNVQDELVRLEVLHGKKQYVIPGKVTACKLTDKPVVQVEKIVDESVLKSESKPKKIKEKPKDTTPVAELVVDVRKLDFRIGKIIEINKHPDADSLYVEKIDCGEENPRTVVSGLVNHVPIDEMRNKIVMVLCNLKPVKMRGVTSEAMVMCASSTEKVEVLLPPSGALPGDLVYCEGYPREPEVQLNPKKKIFETCAPDLKTNDDKVACYKGSPLIVPGKGAVVAPTLRSVNVK